MNRFLGEGILFSACASYGAFLIVCNSSTSQRFPFFPLGKRGDSPFFPFVEEEIPDCSFPGGRNPYRPKERERSYFISPSKKAGTAFPTHRTRSF